MASVVLNEFKRANAAAEIDLNADDIRAILVMSNTTADTENDGIVYVSDYTTLDECDAGGYARVALSGEAVNKDDANDRATFDANDVVFTSLGGDASRNAVGVVLYKHVGADSANPVIVFHEFTSPVTSAATQITVPFAASDILRLT